MVKKWLANQKRPEYNAISGKSMTVKSLWSQWDILILHEGVLYRKWDDLISKSQKLQAVIPNEERRTTLKFCHDDRAVGHLGVHKTLAKIRQSSGRACKEMSDSTLEVVRFAPRGRCLL